MLAIDCVSMSVQVLGMGIYKLKKINTVKIIVAIETSKETKKKLEKHAFLAVEKVSEKIKHGTMS